MDQNVDHLDAVGGITDLVFDEKNHERRSWKFCNSRVPRSEVVYFTQIFIKLFLIAISLIKLLFLQFDCEETTILVFASFLYSRIPSTQPFVVNKIISTNDCLFMAVCGPLCCEKRALIFNMLLNDTFLPKSQAIFYFYQYDQPKFQSFEGKRNIQFTKFLNFDLISDLENFLLVFDNSSEEIFNEKEFSQLATAGRHTNLSVIYGKHNFQ